MERGETGIDHDFNQKSGEILEIIRRPEQIPLHYKKIIDFFDKNSKISLELLKNGNFPSSNHLFLQIQNLCTDSLKNLKTEIDKTGNLNSQFKMPWTEKTKNVKLDMNIINQLLGSFLKVQDVMNLKSADALSNYVILEFFLLSCNNISYIHFKKGKSDRAFQNLFPVLYLIPHLEHSSYYLKYHISTIVLNLAFMLDENHRLEAIKIVANVIEYLCQMEREIDNNKNQDVIYKYIGSKSENFACLISDLLNVGIKPPANKKTFLALRLSAAYHYMSVVLTQVGQKLDAENAKSNSEHYHSQALVPGPSGNRSNNTTFSEDSSRLNVDKKASTMSHKSDAFSAQSFQTAKTGGFTNSAIDFGSSVSKEDIIFEKYVEVGGVKFKIVILNIKEVKSIEIIVYNKPRNIFKKVYIKFTEVLNFAKQSDLTLNGDKDVQKVLTKIIKHLFFKDGELFVRELPYYKHLDEISRENLR